MTFFSWLTRRDPTQQPPTVVYNAIVAQARHVDFYTDLGVPDTMDGRFDLIVLHVTLVIRRLRREGDPGKAFAQELFDAMFRDMDRSLREVGVGDMSIGKKVKKMAQAFYGRASEYERGLNGSDLDLRDALAANLYRLVSATDRQMSGMVERVRAADRALTALTFDDITAARLAWGGNGASQP